MNKIEFATIADVRAHVVALPEDSPIHLGEIVEAIVAGVFYSRIIITALENGVAKFKPVHL